MKTNVLKKIKHYLRISPKCSCFLIVVISWNELGDGFVVDTTGFECCDGIQTPYMEEI